MEDRSQYLGLAQLSQNIVRRILLYLEAGEWEPLKATISQIVEPLEILLSDDIPPAQATAFADYEQLSTLSEAWDKPQTKQVVEHLKELLASDNGLRAKYAEALIVPFQKLSTQALWNFEHPDEFAIPRGILELCKAH